MSRQSENEYKDNRLYNGYDYENQAWVMSGKYVNCGHDDSVHCGCFGRLNAGSETAPDLEIFETVKIYPA